ncbi:MAG: hypothetical protein JNM19_02335 [Chitinophagaceae bacterium]|nr:hypothetical protein [Chitinophagaceae bacterium]
MEFINDTNGGFLGSLFPDSVFENNATYPNETLVSPFKESPFGENWDKHNEIVVQNKKLSHGN